MVFLAGTEEPNICQLPFPEILPSNPSTYDITCYIHVMSFEYVTNRIGIEYLTKVQLTARLALGKLGANAVRLATVEPRRERGRLSKNQRTEELRARIARKQGRAILTNAKVVLASIFQ